MSKPCQKGILSMQTFHKQYVARREGGEGERDFGLCANWVLVVPLLLAHPKFNAAQLNYFLPGGANN